MIHGQRSFGIVGLPRRLDIAAALLEEASSATKSGLQRAEQTHVSIKRISARAPFHHSALVPTLIELIDKMRDLGLTGPDIGLTVVFFNVSIMLVSGSLLS